MQQLTSAFASLILIAMLVAVFLGARRKARESPSARRRLLFSGVAGIVLGVVFVFVLPQRLPETPGSPGTLVGVAFLWIFGSVFLGMSLPVLLGVALARPRTRDD